MSKGFTLVDELKDAVEILKLNKSKMAEVAANKRATTWGVVILVIPVIVNWVLSTITYPSGFGAFFQTYVFGSVLIPVLSVVATIFLLSYVAEKFFGGKGSHIGFFRILAYVSLVMWISMIYSLFSMLSLGLSGLFGLLNLAASIWMFVVIYHVLIEHHRLKKNDAVITIIIGIIAYMIIWKILGRVLVGKYYSLY